MKTFHSSIVAHAAAIAIALLAGETSAQPADAPTGDDSTDDSWIDRPDADADADATIPTVELEDSPDESADAAADSTDPEGTEEQIAADATNEEAELPPNNDAAQNAPAIEMPGGRPSDPVAWSKPTQKMGDGFVFRFNGFIRAPMRVGIGKHKDSTTGKSSDTYHYPVIPDDQYLSWQYSRQNPRDWAELFFTYGNDLAQATVALSAFQFTDSSWNNSFHWLTLGSK